MTRREFCILAHKYDQKAHIGGWYASVKMDGMRGLWDGGITRGMLKSDVPWANCAKDGRYVSKQFATGLWSRYGNVIHAPDWFLDQLPSVPMDGELYTDAVNRQAIFSTIKDLEPSEDWKYIQFHAFDLVPLELWLGDGEIKNTGFQKKMLGCFEWAQRYISKLAYQPKAKTPFITTVELMKQKLVENAALRVHKQTMLPYAISEAMALVHQMCDEVVSKGGEGLVLRSPSCYWQPKRSHELVKVKPTDDAEGIVIGYITGRETDKGSKLLGMMGALVLRLENDKEMELSGFTDAERDLQSIRIPEEATSDQDAKDWAISHPEEQCPDWIEAKFFPRGTRVQFRYRGLSDKGIYQEARYSRVRSED